MDIEHNLLFAVLAFREALIDLPTLTAACRAWSACQEMSLAEVLVNRGALTVENRTHLENLLRCSLHKPQGLSDLGDSDLAASVAGLLLPPPITGPDLPTRIERWLDPSAKPAPTSSSANLAQRYQRLHLHARGGIGQVWLARDTEIDREVALKELRPETVQSPTFRERFLEEARVTGQLEHPGIVPVHELVQPADGEQPYYVMCFVKGRTLSQAVDDYHAKKQAGQATRVDLIALLNAFHAVCNALAFAHAKGVLHRDLKGLNVILGDFGEVIVLDWGLTRRLEMTDTDGGELPRSIPAGRTPTLPGQVMGTPGYMAPEQAAGRTDLIDARTDVYGLGAILYEILTGQPPFTTTSLRNPQRGGTVTEFDLPALLQRIQTEAPLPPRQLQKDIPPALEAVCLKALARRPEDRYASAADLAREVQRWLADEPVQAYREPLTARLGRWGRRHKLIVTGLAVLLVCAVIGLTASTILINQEREQTDFQREKAVQAGKQAVQAGKRAEGNFALARDAVKQSFFQMSEDQLLNAPGSQRLRKKLLRKAKDYFVDLVKLGDNDLAVRRDQGQMLLTLSLVTSDIGESEEALGYLQEAENIFTALKAEQPEEWSHRHNLGRCHLRRGYFLLLSKKAEPQALAELELARQLLQTAGSAPEVQHNLAMYHNNLGNYFDQKGMDAAGELRDQVVRPALAAFAEAEPIWKRLVHDYAKKSEYRHLLAGLYQNLGKIYHQEQKNQQAFEAVDKSLKLRTQLVQEDRDNLDNQWSLGSVHGQLAVCLSRLGWPAGAVAENLKALAILEPLTHQNPKVIRFQTELSNVYFNLAIQEQVQLPNPQAPAFAAAVARVRANYQKALNIYENLRENSPREKKFAIHLAVTYLKLGDLAYLVRKVDGLPWYNKTIEILEPLANAADGSGTVRQALFGAFWGRAEGLDEQGKFALATRAWDRFFAIRLPPPDHPGRLLRTQSRLQWVKELVQQKHFFRAATELEVIAGELTFPGKKAVPAKAFLEAGTLYAVCAQGIQQAGEPIQASRLAERALDFLWKAYNNGMLRRFDQRRDLGKRFQDFEMLRRHRDFQRLVRG